MRHVPIAFATAVVAAIACPRPAAAVVVADAIYTTIVNVANTSYRCSGLAAQPCSQAAADVTATGNIVALPSPLETGSVSASYTSGGPNSTSVLATTEYFFQVVGPAGVNVPIFIAGSSAITDAATSGQGYATGQTQLTLQIGNQQSITTACFNANYTGTTCTDSSSFSVNQAFTATPNVENDIQLSLSLIANAGGASGSTARISGSIDPVVTIDPSFAFASQYSLVFSQGVGNLPNDGPTPTVPEPASLMVLGTALALLRLTPKRRS